MIEIKLFPLSLGQNTTRSAARLASPRPAPPLSDRRGAAGATSAACTGYK